MKKKETLITILCCLFIALCNNSEAQTDSLNTLSSENRKRTLPFGSEWAKKKGIDLPSPFGVTGFFSYMARDIEVTDVTVEFSGMEPKSISDFASFAVGNKSIISAARFDVWILPVVNVYLLAGYAYTTSNLDATFTVDRPLLPSAEIEVQTQTPVKGPYAGIGATAAAGYGKWFILGDFNYGKTLPDQLNNAVSFTMLSVRSGLAGNLGNRNSLKAWIGTIYMNSKCVLEIKESAGELGEILVRIKQQPVNPWTFECGFMVGISDKFEIMTELGSNFNDAAISVLTVSYRF